MITKGLSTHREDVGGAAAATAAAAASAAAGEDVAQIVEVAEFAHGRTAFLADEEVQRRAGRQREDGADRGAVAHRRRRVGHDRRQTTAGALGDDPSGNEPPFVTHSKNGEEEKKTLRACFLAHRVPISRPIPLFGSPFFMHRTIFCYRLAPAWKVLGLATYY